jgi:hypothetical protein
LKLAALCREELDQVAVAIWTAAYEEQHALERRAEEAVGNNDLIEGRRGIAAR